MTKERRPSGSKDRLSGDQKPLGALPRVLPGTAERFRRLWPKYMAAAGVPCGVQDILWREAGVIDGRELVVTEQKD